MHLFCNCGFECSTPALLRSHIEDRDAAGDRGHAFGNSVETSCPGGDPCAAELATGTPCRRDRYGAIVCERRPPKTEPVFEEWRPGRWREKGRKLVEDVKVPPK